MRQPKSFSWSFAGRHKLEGPPPKSLSLPPFFFVRYPRTTLPFIFARSAIWPERASAAIRLRSAFPSIRIRSGSERSSKSACLVSGGSSGLAIP